MNNVRFLDWLGSAAFTIALLSVLLLFVPGLVRADGVMPADADDFIGRADL
ncbi:hypothetical protein [Ketobacter sp.]|uniref:hypothetical protein n=1 Tax=Ketobacter sp. TaxID=2083498 RepID=UPI0025C203A3|nr:hypothetical protein [Ketobacter sp.]MEE2729903.1 hypothetical protein [Pseudomonadota bacterium]